MQAEESLLEAVLIDAPQLTALSSLLLDDDAARPQVNDLFAVQKRKGWDKSVEARCDFTFKLRLTPRAGIHFISIWQKSLMGRTLTEIKADPEEVPHFADSLAPVIQQTLGNSLDSGGWCVCTSPKRRHKIKNFATLVSERIARTIGVPFYEDVALCHSRQRINAEFDLNVLPNEPNIIVVDDFVTTGSTLRAMNDLLSRHGKNTVFFAGINNKL